MSGNVIFTWTPSNYFSYYVCLTRDTTVFSAWTLVSDYQYTERNVLQCDSITINVRTPGSAVNNILKYNGNFFLYFLSIEFEVKLIDTSFQYNDASAGKDILYNSTLIFHCL